MSLSFFFLFVIYNNLYKVYHKVFFFLFAIYNNLYKVYHKVLTIFIKYIKLEQGRFFVHCGDSGS